MLTKEDESLIARAILVALAKWSVICLAVAVVVWLIRVALHDFGGE
jgi:hypothetical protein